MSTWKQIPNEVFVEINDSTPPKYRISTVGIDGKRYSTAQLYQHSSPTPPTPGVPLAYKAITDRIARPEPLLSILGPAGSRFADTMFGTETLRATDDNTFPGIVGRSYRVPSSAHTTMWSSDSNMFYVVNTNGACVPYRFDPAAMTASRIPDSANPTEGGMTISSQVEPSFSRLDPDIIYVNGGPNNHSIYAHHVSTHARDFIVNVEDLGFGPLTDTYIGGLLVGGTPEVIIAIFGGNIIDAHYLAVWQPVDGGVPILINTMSLPVPFHIHAMQIDRTGRWVFFYPADADRKANPALYQVYLWDTETRTIGPIKKLNSGHDTAGYANWINQCCCTDCPYDAAQWQYRSLTDLNATRDLISPVLTPKEVYLSDHTSWHNAQPDKLVPIISGTYRYSDVDDAGNPVPWRPWDDEVVAIDPNNGTVWRFGQHRSDVADEHNPGGLYSWYEPRPSISPNGLYIAYTSNREKSLGTDTGENRFRQDVFIMKLVAA